jgi:hypothetical protein
MGMDARRKKAIAFCSLTIYLFWESSALFIYLATSCVNVAHPSSQHASIKRFSWQLGSLIWGVGTLNFSRPMDLPPLRVDCRLIQDDLIAALTKGAFHGLV